MNFATFEQSLNDFQDYLASRRCSIHTQRAYAADLRQMVYYWNTLKNPGESSLQQVMPSFVTGLYSRNLSAPSLARKLSCIKTYEVFLEERYKVTLSIPYQRPQLPTRTVTHLSRESLHALVTVEEKKLLTEKPYRDKAIMWLLYETGMLASEVINVRVEDLSLELQSICIRSRTRRERHVGLPTGLCVILKHYFQKERKKVVTRSEFLFLNHRYAPLTTRSIQRICNLFSTLLELPDIILTPNMLRHSRAIHLLADGATLKQIQDFFGHATSSAALTYAATLKKGAHDTLAS